MSRKRNLETARGDPTPPAVRDGCQWIEGSPNLADPFCGKPRSQNASGKLLPYCRDHARRAYLRRRPSLAAMP